jgi:hypothetical protein
MPGAPIVVHRPSEPDGRRVTAHGAVIGMARDDFELVELLRQAGLEDPWPLLDNPAWVEWRGGHPHHWGAGG